MKKNVIITKDGSPSLNFVRDDDEQMMHSREGAFSETEYIYGEAVSEILKQKNGGIHATSIGLGFGYVEFSFLARMMKEKRRFQLVSYESEENLVESLKNFLNNQESEYENEYKTILKLYSEKFLLDLNQFKSFLQKAIENGSWVFKKDFHFQDQEKPVNLIQFDPFCSRFHPEVWQKNELNKWLANNTDKICVFSTYAAKGDLKRALKENGFKIMPRKGFAYKRESTLAIKGEGFDDPAKDR